MRFVLFACLLAAGCAAPGADPWARESARLSRDLATRTAGPPRACIPVPIGPGSLVPVDAQTLRIDGGGALWVNRLRAPCPGLRPFSTLIVEVSGGDYCSGDHLRAVDVGARIPGPVCFLGDFTPYRAAADS